ncbi:MAG: biopolymer transporter ExbD [Hydrogenophilales bacterium CG17_big_fil_post_rev_8_21_14_2_50_63_12]|nr:MAG: biopolymer transporter ExbD [Hydrogenophilales bacterium CG17_big_fil_post_rev_8_21_14_2_50_63_12]PIX95717.1 MAG: biopolymer transporter ExbD [Hydrogenophilales bacterium CG_4_10_14_3_um_filter_63_21]PJB05352.1 MAG: biopolymer transporter ExbD [Hydrogenophilales bacterium CG_4_9_14_3_um_filter_63_34]
MNFSPDRRRDAPEINLIPLIDVLLVILIFLMVTTTYARFSELQINLPQAKGDSAKEMPAQITVNVDDRGSYSVNSTGVAYAGVDSLVRALKTAAGRQPDPVIVISADAQATHQSVIRVMDAARRAGYPRVTFVTQSPTQE